MAMTRLVTNNCIEQAIIMAQQIKEGGRDYPVPMEIYR